MDHISTIEKLEELYGPAVPGALAKVRKEITPYYRKWIEASRFMIISTVGPEGTDGSPRGDNGPVVHIIDDTTIHIPDWKGNNRLDTLKNIIRDKRISLLFMVPGSNNVVRVNGVALISAKSSFINGFAKSQKTPKSVIIVTVDELYVQCAKAIIRSKIWSGKDESSMVPTVGDFTKEKDSSFDAKAYDDGYTEYAKTRMW